MKKLLSLLFLLVLTIVGSLLIQEHKAYSQNNLEQTVDFQRHFEQLGVNGSIVIYDLDNFWLEGELKITPQQQITFLRRLYQNDLPFDQKNIDLVKDIAIAEQTPDYVLRSKTGWTGKIGWYVGYLEQNDNVYFFATNLDMNAQTDPAVRLEITRLCLQDLGLL